VGATSRALHCLAMILAMMLVLAPALCADQSDFPVAAFGAVGDGIHDDGPAIRQAIAAAVKAAPGSRVLLETKTYRLKENPTQDYQFELVNTRGKYPAGSTAGT